MKLEARILRLIAVGASITANCQPCLQTSISEALANDADEQEIIEAIEVGRLVRKGAASKMDVFLSSLKQAEALRAAASSEACDCGQPTPQR